MRIFSRVSVRVFSTVALLAACSLPVAKSQMASPTVPACDGRLAMVRVSDIAPTGSVAGFMAALAAHQEWYKSHGFTDQIFMAKVLVYDAASKSYSYSDKEFLTFHVYPPTSMGEPKHDAAWDAYVKMYKDNSVIKTSYFTCMAKGM